MTNFSKTCPALLLLALALASCENSTRIKGLPEKLPVINITAPRGTPPHGLERANYPFEPDGDYNLAWAAEGGQGAGMDFSSWRSSHGTSSRSGGSRKKTASKSTKAKSTGRSSTYTIKSGDTLGGIARKHGTTVAKLKAANGLKSDLIRAGKTLRIPR